MRAIVITRPGGPEVLELHEVATPEPASDYVRVRVMATAVNRADLLQRSGSYPAPPGSPRDIPGLEYCGVVDSVGPMVVSLQPGQRVFGITGGGAYAEYVVVHERMVAPIPDNLDWTFAAAVPEVFMTAHDALQQAGFAPGDRVLIHAVGSGVGTAAVQLVHVLGGTSYGTARSPEKLLGARDLGLDAGMLAEGWRAEMARYNTGVDIVLDFVGGAYLADNLDALAPRGRLVLIGMLSGSRTEVDLAAIQRKRLRVVGTLLRSRPLEEKIAVTQSFARQVLPLLARGQLRPVLDRVFPLAEAAEAHRYMERNQNFGKIVLEVAH
jgi:NADPH:quinone reductase